MLVDLLSLVERIQISKSKSNFIKKETLAQVFSRKFCEISKNTFFHRTPPVAASFGSPKKNIKIFHMPSNQVSGKKQSIQSLPGRK